MTFRPLLLYILTLTLASPLVSGQGVITAPPYDMRYRAVAKAEAPEYRGKQYECQFAQCEKVFDGPSVDGSGSWESLADGSVVWSVGYSSESAKNMSVMVRDVVLPAGGMLCVMDSLGEQCTEFDMRDMGSPLVSGDHIVVQYSGPASPLPSFVITDVFSGYRSVEMTEGRNKATGYYGASTECEQAAACKDDIEEVRRSVCRIVVNGMYLGTANLINNTALDRSPLIITSAHVIGTSTLTSIKAMFCFEEPVCDTEYYNYYSETISGGELLAYDETADVAVIKLASSPSIVSRPYWCGWSRSLSVSGSVYCVHHPAGDVKKVSTANFVSPNNNYSGTTSASGVAFRSSMFWRVSEWKSGATEGGSSGSGLHNKDGLIVGCLTGGASSCSYQKDDYYWMIGKAWSYSSDGYSSLSDILDPAGSSPTKLAGLDMVTDGGQTACVLANYSNNGSIASLETALSLSNPQVSTAFESTTSDRSIWAVRLYSSSLNCSSTKADGPTVAVSISTGDEEGLGESSRLLNIFSTFAVKDFVLSEPVNILAGNDFTVDITALNFTEDDNLYLMSADDESPMLSLVYAYELYTASGKDNATRTIEASQSNTTIKIKRDEEQLTVYRTNLSVVALYDISGHCRRTVNVNGASEANVSLCDIPSGLYIMRVLASNGTTKSFKLINR